MDAGSHEHSFYEKNDCDCAGSGAERDAGR